MQDKLNTSGNIDIADGVIALVLLGIGVVATAPISAPLAAAVGIGTGISFSFLKIVMGSSLNILVAPAVAIWTTRCRYGHPDDEVQMLPYEAMEDEQSGLDLVFSGVTVEMVVRNPALEMLERYGGGIPNQRMWEMVHKNAQNSRERIVEILVTVPDLERMEVGLRLTLGERTEREDRLLDLNYIKTEVSGTLQDRRGEEAEENVKISKSGRLYSITAEEKVLIRQPQELLSLYINFLVSDRGSEPKMGLFEVRA